MSKVELRALQMFYAIMIVGMTWMMAIGEAFFIHHLMLCACVLGATASLLIKPYED
jgi:hypothetical protein